MPPVLTIEKDKCLYGLGHSYLLLKLSQTGRGAFPTCSNRMPQPNPEEYYSSEVQSHLTGCSLFLTPSQDRTWSTSQSCRYLASALCQRWAACYLLKLQMGGLECSQLPVTGTEAQCQPWLHDRRLKQDSPLTYLCPPPTLKSLIPNLLPSFPPLTDS